MGIDCTPALTTDEQHWLAGGMACDIERANVLRAGMERLSCHVQWLDGEVTNLHGLRGGAGEAPELIKDACKLLLRAMAECRRAREGIA